MHRRNIDLSPRDMDQSVTPASWKRFYVHIPGTRNVAYEALIAKLQGVGHTEMSSAADCDYILNICPISSRVGADVSNALENMPGGKPVILVVMHHTFDSNYVLADSKKQVTHADVCLTVDCLFHENRLLQCNRNDIAWIEIRTFLGVSMVSDGYNTACIWMRRHWWKAALGIATVAITVIIIVVEERKKLGP
ncbi:uncharacterized protein [Pempheris klunzingeri]|uniref:uncharacterized protein isoform X2 n=1 Tax=Pempheris klunzingeri TaxID=3127111 RepID=UPI00398169D5